MQFERASDHYPPLNDPAGGGQDRVVIYHVHTGPAVTSRIDAQEAIANHPTIWSTKPW